MSEENRASRRAALKSLGAVGAIVALGGTATAQNPTETKPAKTDIDKQAANPVDLAVASFAKGYS